MAAQALSRHQPHSENGQIIYVMELIGVFVSVQFARFIEELLHCRNWHIWLIGLI